MTQKASIDRAALGKQLKIAIRPRLAKHFPDRTDAEITTELQQTSDEEFFRQMVVDLGGDRDSSLKDAYAAMFKKRGVKAEVLKWAYKAAKRGEISPGAIDDADAALADVDEGALIDRLFSKISDADLIPLVADPSSERAQALFSSRMDPGFLDGLSDQERAKERFLNIKLPLNDPGTEQEIIEWLNAEEYKLHLIQHYPLGAAGVDESEDDLRFWINKRKQTLIRMFQGETLDRFGLRRHSKAELEQLLQDTEDTIKSLESQGVARGESYRKLAAKVPNGGFIQDVFGAFSQTMAVPSAPDYELWKRKQLRSAIQLRLKTVGSDPPPPPKQQTRGAAEIQAELDELHGKETRARATLKPGDVEAEKQLENIFYSRRRQLLQDSQAR